MLVDNLDYFIVDKKCKNPKNVKFEICVGYMMPSYTNY
jgi:hypothetical protein